MSKVIDYLKNTHNKYSVSRIGWSYLIAIGEPKSADKALLSIPSGLSHFIEILADGSIRTRILLFDCGNEDNAIVDNTITLGLGDFYEGIYKNIFGDELIKHFVYARKYEKLTVLKQFRARYVDRGDVLDKEKIEEIRPSLFETPFKERQSDDFDYSLEGKKVKSRLKANKLSQSWLVTKLAVNGLIIDNSFLSLTLSGRKITDKGKSIIAVSNAIIDSYEEEIKGSKI